MPRVPQILSDGAENPELSNFKGYTLYHYVIYLAIY